MLKAYGIGDTVTFKKGSKYLYKNTYFYLMEFSDTASLIKNTQNKVTRLNYGEGVLIPSQGFKRSFTSNESDRSSYDLGIKLSSIGELIIDRTEMPLPNFSSVISDFDADQIKTLARKALTSSNSISTDSTIIIPHWPISQNDLYLRACNIDTENKNLNKINILLNKNLIENLSKEEQKNVKSLPAIKKIIGELDMNLFNNEKNIFSTEYLSNSNIDKKGFESKNDLCKLTKEHVNNNISSFTNTYVNIIKNRIPKLLTTIKSSRETTGLLNFCVALHDNEQKWREKILKDSFNHRTWTTKNVLDSLSKAYKAIGFNNHN